MKDKITLSDLMTPDIYRLWENLERLKLSSPLTHNTSFWAEFISRSGAEFGRQIDLYTGIDISFVKRSEEILRVNLYASIQDCYTPGHQNLILTTFELDWS